MDVLHRWALALGKTPVKVKDSPGFVVNRLLMPYVNEAVLLVTEGLGIEQVDGLMRRFGMPMGPLEMLDTVGLDVAAHIADGMQPAFGDRYAPNPTFRRMSQGGWLGQKTGAGFYRHRGRKSASTTMRCRCCAATRRPTWRRCERCRRRRACSRPATAWCC